MTEKTGTTNGIRWWIKEWHTALGNWAWGATVLATGQGSGQFTEAEYEAQQELDAFIAEHGTPDEVAPEHMHDETMKFLRLVEMMGAVTGDEKLVEAVQILQQPDEAMPTSPKFKRGDVIQCGDNEALRATVERDYFEGEAEIIIGNWCYRNHPVIAANWRKTGLTVTNMPAPVEGVQVISHTTPPPFGEYIPFTTADELHQQIHDRIEDHFRFKADVHEALGLESLDGIAAHDDKQLELIEANRKAVQHAIIYMQPLVALYAEYANTPGDEITHNFAGWLAERFDGDRWQEFENHFLSLTAFVSRQEETAQPIANSEIDTLTMERDQIHAEMVGAKTALAMLTGDPEVYRNKRAMDALINLSGQPFFKDVLIRLESEGEPQEAAAQLESAAMIATQSDFDRVWEAARKLNQYLTQEPAIEAGADAVIQVIKNAQFIIEECDPNDPPEPDYNAYLAAQEHTENERLDRLEDEREVQEFIEDNGYHPDEHYLGRRADSLDD